MQKLLPITIYHSSPHTQEQFELLRKHIEFLFNSKKINTLTYQDFFTVKHLTADLNNIDRYHLLFLFWLLRQQQLDGHSGLNQEQWTKFIRTWNNSVALSHRIKTIVYGNQYLRGDTDEAEVLQNLATNFKLVGKPDQVLNDVLAYYGFWVGKRQLMGFTQGFILREFSQLTTTSSHPLEAQKSLFFKLFAGLVSQLQPANLLGQGDSPYVVKNLDADYVLFPLLNQKLTRDFLQDLSFDWQALDSQQQVANELEFKNEVVITAKLVGKVIPYPEVQDACAKTFLSCSNELHALLLSLVEVCNQHQWNEADIQEYLAPLASQLQTILSNYQTKILPILGNELVNRTKNPVALKDLCNSLYWEFNRNNQRQLKVTLDDHPLTSIANNLNSIFNFAPLSQNWAISFFSASQLEPQLRRELGAELPPEIFDHLEFPLEAKAAQAIIAGLRESLYAGLTALVTWIPGLTKDQPSSEVLAQLLEKFPSGKEGSNLALNFARLQALTSNRNLLQQALDSLVSKTAGGKVRALTEEQEQEAKRFEFIADVNLQFELFPELKYICELEFNQSGSQGMQEIQGMQGMIAGAGDVSASATYLGNYEVALRTNFVQLVQNEKRLEFFTEYRKIPAPFVASVGEEGEAVIWSFSEPFRLESEILEKLTQIIAKDQQRPQADNAADFSNTYLEKLNEKTESINYNISDKIFRLRNLKQDELRDSAQLKLDRVSKNLNLSEEEKEVQRSKIQEQLNLDQQQVADEFQAQADAATGIVDEFEKGFVDGKLSSLNLATFQNLLKNPHVYNVIRHDLMGTAINYPSIRLDPEAKLSFADQILCLFAKLIDKAGAEEVDLIEASSFLTPYKYPLVINQIAYSLFPYALQPPVDTRKCKKMLDSYAAEEVVIDGANGSTNASTSDGTNNGVDNGEKDGFAEYDFVRGFQTVFEHSAAINENDTSILLNSPDYQVDYYLLAKKLVKFFLIYNFAKRNEEDIEEYLKLSDEKILALIPQSEQTVAIINSIDKDLSIIIGGPGTGKTTTVFQILVINSVFMALQQKFAKYPQIGLGAPTAKASEHLQSSITSKARTLFKEILMVLEENVHQHGNSILPFINSELAAEVRKAVNYTDASGNAQADAETDLDSDAQTNSGAEPNSDTETNSGTDLQVISNLFSTAKSASKSASTSNSPRLGSPFTSLLGRLLADLGKNETQALYFALQAIIFSKDKTLHRWLGIHQGKPRGIVEDGKSLELDFLIVDEVGMANLEMTHTLLKAIDKTKLILLGDKDQLPSIGVGYTLANISRQYRPHGYSPRTNLLLADFGEGDELAEPNSWYSPSVLRFMSENEFSPSVYFNQRQFLSHAVVEKLEQMAVGAKKLGSKIKREAQELIAQGLAGVQQDQQDQPEQKSQQAYYNSSQQISGLQDYPLSYHDYLQKLVQSFRYSKQSAIEMYALAVNGDLDFNRYLEFIAKVNEQMLEFAPVTKRAGDLARDDAQDRDLSAKEFNLQYSTQYQNLVSLGIVKTPEEAKAIIIDVNLDRHQQRQQLSKAEAESGNSVKSTADTTDTVGSLDKSASDNNGFMPLILESSPYLARIYRGLEEKNPVDMAKVALYSNLELSVAYQPFFSRVATLFQDLTQSSLEKIISNCKPETRAKIDNDYSLKVELLKAREQVTKELEHAISKAVLKPCDALMFPQALPMPQGYNNEDIHEQLRTKLVDTLQAQGQIQLNIYEAGRVQLYWSLYDLLENYVKAFTNEQSPEWLRNRIYSAPAFKEKLDSYVSQVISTTSKLDWLHTKRLLKGLIKELPYLGYFASKEEKQYSELVKNNTNSADQDKAKIYEYSYRYPAPGLFRELDFSGVLQSVKNTLTWDSGDKISRPNLCEFVREYEASNDETFIDLVEEIYTHRVEKAKSEQQKSGKSVNSQTIKTKILQSSQGNSVAKKIFGNGRGGIDEELVDKVVDAYLTEKNFALYALTSLVRFRAGIEDEYGLLSKIVQLEEASSEELRSTPISWTQLENLVKSYTGRFGMKIPELNLKDFAQAQVISAADEAFTQLRRILALLQYLHNLQKLVEQIRGKTFNYVEANSSNSNNIIATEHQLAALVTKLASDFSEERITGYRNQLLQAAFAALSRVRFLSPLRKGPLGVNALNQAFNDNWRNYSLRKILEPWFMKNDLAQVLTDLGLSSENYWVTKSASNDADTESAKSDLGYYLQVLNEWLGIDLQFEPSESDEVVLSQLWLQVDKYHRHFFEQNLTTSPIMVTENQAELNLVNSDFGISMKMDNVNTSFFIKASTGGKVMEVATEQIRHYEYAFFTSVHKAQGDEFDHTHVVLPLEITDFISQPMFYTAITRVKHKLYIYAPAQFLQNTGFASIDRLSSLDFDWSDMKE